MSKTQRTFYLRAADSDEWMQVSGSVFQQCQLRFAEAWDAGDRSEYEGAAFCAWDEEPTKK